MPFKKPSDYDSAKAFGQSDFKALPKGGYICRILQIEEKDDKNNRPMVHIAFDIIEGEYTGYFMNLYQSRKRNSDHPMDVKFPFEGQMWIPIYDYEDPTKTASKFKGFCTALEGSGTQVWSPNNDFLMQNIKDAELGIVFQNQESEYNGKTSWRAVPWGCRSVESIESGDYYIPDDKPLPEKPQSNSFGTFEPNNFNATDDGLPF